VLLNGRCCDWRNRTAARRARHYALTLSCSDVGNVCVSWTTKAPGLYSIFIKLHGEDILFSPYICKIEDRTWCS